CLFLMVSYCLLTVTFSQKLFFFMFSFPAVIYIVMQIYCATLYQPREKRKYAIRPEEKVAVIMPCCNESAEIVENVLRQLTEASVPIDEIYFVDDGSFNLSAYHKAIEMRKALYEKSSLPSVASEHFAPDKEIHIPELIVHRFKENRGKRQAQAWAVQQTDADFIITVDADGTMNSDAIEQLLIPFKDPEVMAITSQIEVLNTNDHLFTKTMDLHYHQIFQLECAAPSVTGNILYCSGPLSCYRRDVFAKNLQAYTGQSFLGKSVDAGDDRHLTMHANGMGKTVYQSTAICQTEVPAPIKSFCSQQLRWGRSFIIESMLSLKHYFSHHRKLFFWTLGELAVSFLVIGGLLLDILFHPSSLWQILLLYTVFIVLLSYARNSFYFFKKPLEYFLLSLLQGLVQFVIVYSLRIYALFSLLQFRLK